jgi:hypothetical protein
LLVVTLRGSLALVRRRIPAILNIDVEPDGFQVRDGTISTAGYDAAVEMTERLRPRLAEATGRPPHFGWYFRMDPQIREVYGRADYLVTGFGDLARRIEVVDPLVVARRFLGESRQAANRETAAA